MNFSAKYIVINEHTLGYMIQKIPNVIGDYYSVGLLRASVLKGSPYSEMSGSIIVSPSDDVRAATIQDFEDYHVTVPKDFN